MRTLANGFKMLLKYELSLDDDWAGPKIICCKFCITNVGISICNELDSAPANNNAIICSSVKVGEDSNLICGFCNDPFTWSVTVYFFTLFLAVNSINGSYVCCGIKVNNPWVIRSGL